MGKVAIGAAIGTGAVALLIWYAVFMPSFLNTPDIFEVSAQNVGEIQLADEVGGPLSDPIKMVFVWNGRVQEIDGNNLHLRTSYEYKDILTDEVLWVTVLDETVDRNTRAYVDKEGHFMFPSDLQQRDYKVYDVGGAVMDYRFVGVTEIDGLEVYEFTGQTTFDVSDVYPDFEEQIFEDYSATNFIEPLSGVEVSFREEFTDYAIVDGEKVPVLVASDGPSPFSQKILVQKAQTFKMLHELYHDVIPIVIIFLTAAGTGIIVLQSMFRKEQAQVTELKQVETKKDEFSSMIAHELKTPLVPIKSYLDMIISGQLGQLSPQQIEKLQVVRSSADSLHKLINDLSDVQKIESGNLKATFDEHSLNDIVKEVLIQLEPDFAKKDLEINTVLKSVFCVCDKTRISQVLLNLLTNSIDFTPSSGKITISLTKEDSFAKIVVEDNGSGIPTEKIENIFQKYYQVDSSATREYGGTGLGLAITKGIVDLHHGKISVDSAVGKFTKFTILLPLDQNENSSSIKPEIEN